MEHLLDFAKIGFQLGITLLLAAGTWWLFGVDVTMDVVVLQALANFSLAGICAVVWLGVHLARAAYRARGGCA